MWALANDTCYAAAVTLAADREGRDLFITVLKATFDIAPDGSTQPSAVQMPVSFAPIFGGNPMRTSLLLESDVDYANPGVDFLVQGNAKAPGGEPVHSLIVGFEVAGRLKLLRVHGARIWERRGVGIAPSQPQPFVEMPLDWERAFGGWDPAEDGGHDERNPAGCGYARDYSLLLDRLAPSLEYHDEPINSWRVLPRPAGFGPVARHWKPRRELSGTYDKRWLDERMPLLPLDFDERFFLAAPKDQQFENLPNRSLVRIFGMTVAGPLVFQLPRIAIGLTIWVSGQEVYRRPRLRSVLVLPNIRKVVLTYHDAMPCTERKYEINRAELVEKEFISPMSPDQRI